MKRFMFILFSLFLMMSFIGCSEDAVDGDLAVTFDAQGGSTVISQEIVTGGKVTKPSDPTLADSTFGGWYTETAYQNAWDFDNDTVTSAITLYAKWIADADVTAVATDKTSLTIGYNGSDDASSITQDLTLATSGANGTTITWSSSDVSLIATNGTVNNLGGGTVTLTATITKGNASDTVEFADLTVKAGKLIRSGVDYLFETASLPGKVYMAGINKTNATHTPVVDCYDTATGTLTTLGTFPTPSENTSAMFTWFHVFSETEIYVSYYLTTGGSLHIVKWNGTSWNEVFSDSSYSIYNASITVDSYNGNLYVGYLSSTYYFEVKKFTTSTATMSHLTTSTIETLGYGREGFCVVDENNIYCSVTHNPSFTMWATYYNGTSWSTVVPKDTITLANGVGISHMYATGNVCTVATTYGDKKIWQLDGATGTYTDIGDNSDYLNSGYCYDNSTIYKTTGDNGTVTYKTWNSGTTWDSIGTVTTANAATQYGTTPVVEGSWIYSVYSISASGNYALYIIRTPKP